MVSLGFSVTDVVAWSFILWPCVEIWLCLDQAMETKMKAAIHIALESLAALRGPKG
jgi:hypothetical protein